METKKELLYDGIYYDITHWAKKHPGGKIIEMYTSKGEDCTIAVQQFHQRSTKKVMSIMKSLPQRKPNDSDKIDPVKQKKNDALTKDLTELYETLLNEGLFTPDPVHVFFRISEILLFVFVGMYLLLVYPQNLFLRIVGCIILFLGMGRSGWVMHEGGHHSLLGIPKVDRMIRSLVYGVLLGLAGCYWSSQHSRHHAMPQHVKNDIDLQSLPLIAFNKKMVKDPKMGQNFLIQNQKWLFVLIDTVLIAVAWKVYIHPRCCILKGRYEDLCFMALHYYIFSPIGIANYFVIIWMASLYLLGNIMLSHSHLEVTEEPTHWVEYALTHTANIRSSSFGWVDYWMGNLNYQIEHHLFPTMPQYRNKLCRDRVKALAKKHNLPYYLYSYGEAVEKTLNNLGTVAKELASN